MRDTCVTCVTRPLFRSRWTHIGVMFHVTFTAKAAVTQRRACARGGLGCDCAYVCQCLAVLDSTATRVFMTANRNCTPPLPSQPMPPLPTVKPQLQETRRQTAHDDAARHSRTLTRGCIAATTEIHVRYAPRSCKYLTRRIADVFLVGGGGGSVARLLRGGPGEGRLDDVRGMPQHNAQRSSRDSKDS